MKRQVLYEMMKKIAVLYMRMSTDMQEHSIESQERGFDGIRKTEWVRCYS